VRELREHRLDEEEDAAEVAKEVEGVRKEREILTKKMKLLEQSLAAINQVRGEEEGRGGGEVEGEGSRREGGNGGSSSSHAHVGGCKSSRGWVQCLSMGPQGGVR
jgi:hypothetical protein